jgi:tetratricopeptide (TPR) repeat protein
MGIQRINLRPMRINGLVGIFLFVIATGASQSALTQDPIQALYTEAQTAKARGDTSAAIEKLRAILKLNPKLGPVYHNLGILYFEQGKFQEASQAFDAGLQQDSNMSGSLVPLGISYYQMGQLEKAREVLQKAVKLKVEDPSAQLYLGRTLFDLGQPEAGVAVLQEASRQSPKDSRILYELGQMHLKMATGILKKLENLDPDSYLVHLIHAQMMEGMENYQGALVQYKKAAAKEPNLPYAHYNIGNVYWLMRKWDEAAAEFKLEIVVNPYDCLAYAQLGNMLVKNHGAATQARAYVRKALDLCPNLSQARMDFGLLLADGGEYDKAIEQYKRAAELNPEDDGVHLLLGRAYQKLGRQEEAKAEFATAQNLQKNSSERERARRADVGTLQ